MKFNKVIFCLLMTVMFGCASKGKTVVTLPMSLNTAQYKSLAIEITTDEKNDSKIGDLESLVAMKLRNTGMFANVCTVRTSCAVPYDLLLQIRISDLRKVSDFSRIMFGALAGRAKIQIDASIVDPMTAQKLGSFTAEGKSSGGTIFAGTTSQALSKVSDEIVQYFKSNSFSRTVESSVMN